MKWVLIGLMIGIGLVGVEYPEFVWQDPWGLGIFWSLVPRNLCQNLLFSGLCAAVGYLKFIGTWYRQGFIFGSSC